MWPNRFGVPSWQGTMHNLNQVNTKAKRKRKSQNRAPKHHARPQAQGPKPRKTKDNQRKPSTNPRKSPKFKKVDEARPPKPRKGSKFQGKPQKTKQKKTEQTPAKGANLRQANSSGLPPTAFQRKKREPYEKPTRARAQGRRREKKEQTNQD